ncbi:DciA family protein [Myroides sp. LJL119]
MKKFNPNKPLRDNFSVKDILQIIIKENPLESGINNIRIKEVWYSILGPGVGSYTLDLMLKNQILYVRLSSPIVREELSYGKSKIIALLNEELAQQVITDIIFR